MRFLEETVNSEILVFIDSDMLVLAEPVEFCLPDACDLALRPVDSKNVGARNEKDPHFGFWQKIYELLHVTSFDYVECTWTRERILEYFNAGLVVGRRSAGIFSTWRRSFEKIANAGLMPPDGEPLFLEQVSLAATVSQKRYAKRILSPSYNYPIHVHFLMQEGCGRLEPSDIVTAHYHKLLDNEEGKIQLLNGLGNGRTRVKVERLISGLGPYVIS